MAAKLILIRGLPGSGKSTLAIKLLKPGWKHFEADQFHMKNGEYRYDVTRAGQGHAWCLSHATAAIELGKKVIVANTFTTLKELQPYLEMAERKNVPVSIIHCIGQYETIHGVPAEVIEKMHNRWEGMDEEILFDPEEDTVPEI